MTKNTPGTGRIGRFAKIVENELDQDSFLRIMQYFDIYALFKPDTM